MPHTWRGPAGATRLLLVAVGLFGVAHLALLPPWEGFDEYTHWSYLQQIADTGTIPILGQARISADVDAYPGPMPYDSVGADGNKPTYRAYHAAGSPPLGPATDRRFRPGVGLNWQAQHPPLFYALLAPVYGAARSLAWPEHLFALRLAAWIIAWAGLCVGVLATERLLPERAPGVPMLMAAYPFFVPEFFPEMARLGNDSLCLLLAAIAWALMLKLLSARRGRWDAAWLGAVLGLGLLTKAFFLAIDGGVAALLALRWRARPTRTSDLVVCVGLAAAIGGAWYVRNLMSFGDIVGGKDAILLAQAGGLASGLRQHASLAELLRGLAVIPATFAGAGTWSLARLPEPLLAVPLALVGCGVAGWVLRLRKAPLAADPILWLPAFLLAPILLGLLLNHLQTVALYGRAITPGWYLHILAPPIGFVIAVGWRWPVLMRWLTAGSVAVGACGWVLQLALFSGCATKNAAKHYDLSGAACLIDWHQLGVLAMPSVGLSAIAAGAAAALAALAATRSPPPPAPPARAAPASR